jgi:hypothetical protein
MANAFNNARNILVGAAPVYISVKDSTDPTYTENMLEGGDIALSPRTSARSTLDTNTKFRNVGYTNNGLQITYNPTYDSVTVDQLLDTAKLFKSAMEVMIATEMTEGTLENVLVVFGQGSNTKTGSLTKGASGSQDTSETLGLEAGALGIQPTERQLVAVGAAPTIDSASANISSERVYYARRVLSVQQSQFSLARNTPTTFPVTFRLLPDARYAGSEYGKIIDRVLG